MDVFPTRERLLSTDAVPAKEAHEQLSNVRRSEAGIAALAPGQVEWLVRQCGAAGVVARGEHDKTGHSYLLNELGAVE